MSIFYQIVTDYIMQILVMLHYPLEHEFAEEEDSLDYEERSGLRYTAGYTIRALLKKVEQSKSKQSEELKCLEEMIDNDDSIDDSAKWTKSIDRGGLIYVNDIVFSVFAEMELAVRRNINKKNPTQDLRQLLNLYNEGCVNIH